MNARGKGEKRARAKGEKRARAKGKETLVLMERTHSHPPPSPLLHPSLLFSSLLMQRIKLLVLLSLLSGAALTSATIVRFTQKWLCDYIIFGLRLFNSSFFYPFRKGKKVTNIFKVTAEYYILQSRMPLAQNCGGMRILIHRRIFLKSF